MSDAGPDPTDAPASPRGPSPRTPPRDTAAAHEGWARVLAALAALLLGALMLPGPNDFPLDDAWIHLSYAKSLRLGDGMSYNPGDWELGFSSPLWALLLSAWPIDGATVQAVQLLGLLLHAVTAGLAAHLGLQLALRRATLERPLPVLSLTLLVGALAAATPTLVQAAGSGMEVSLTAALVLAVSWAVLLGHPRAALAMGLLAVWARPEALGFVVALAGVLVPWHWRQGERGPRLRAPLMAMGGALLALASWMTYCQLDAGQWWPNAQYVKGPGGGPAGLHYLTERVLPWQPWLVSLTGVVLLGLALRQDLRQRRPELLALLVAGLATWVAIALGRPLDPAILFHQSRYFAPFAVVFAVLLPFGLVGARRWLGLGLVLPVAIACGLQLQALHEQSQDLRADTHQLHTAVAHHIEQLPRDARVAVEGAGAPRFWAPRSMTILDLAGLNDHRMARHHGDTRGKLCHLVRSRPTHVAIPADWIPQLAPVFRLTPIARFEDPVYTQVDPPRALTVVLMTVDEIHPAWVEGCAALPH